MKRVCFLLPALVLIGNAIFAQTGGGIFAPFVSRLRADVNGRNILLSWVDSDSVKGSVYVFRSSEPFKRDTVFIGEGVEVPYGVCSYRDIVPSNGIWYYLVAASDYFKRIYNVTIPFNNTVNVSVSGAVVLEIEGADEYAPVFYFFSGDQLRPEPYQQAYAETDAHPVTVPSAALAADGVNDYPPASVYTVPAESPPVAVYTAPTVPQSIPAEPPPVAVYTVPTVPQSVPAEPPPVAVYTVPTVPQSAPAELPPVVVYTAPIVPESAHAYSTAPVKTHAITGIRATALENGIEITFSDITPGKNAVLYRSTRPFLGFSDMLAATVVALNAKSPYIDTPPPGIPYYYAVVHEYDIKNGQGELSPGNNITLTPAEIPLRRNARTPQTSNTQAHSQTYRGTNETPIIREPQVFDRDMRPTTDAADKRLGAIVQGPFTWRDWRTARSNMATYLAGNPPAAAANRARFYVAQCDYFLGDMRTALSEFLKLQQVYPDEVSTWIQACLNKIADR